MSEDYAIFPEPMLQPLLRAKDYLERRGQQLPAAALRLLAREVILRVSLAATELQDQRELPPRGEIDLLADALLSLDDGAASDLVRAARLSGVSAQKLYHVHIAGAVREIGVRWEQDSASSAQVVLGAGRVYAILRDLRAVFLSERLVAPPGAEAVFATVPGEVHGVGTTMAADMMRLKGWTIALRVGCDHDRLVEEIAALSPMMVGLSLASPWNTLAAARLIVALRMRCPQVWIILGGPLVAEDPEVVAAVDADAGAADLEEGAAKLTAHLAELNRLACA